MTPVFGPDHHDDTPDHDTDPVNRPADAEPADRPVDAEPAADAEPGGDIVAGRGGFADPRTGEE